MRNSWWHTRTHRFLSNSDASAVPISDLDEGQRGVVHQLHGGRTFVNRLTALGVSIGVEVTVIQNRQRGPLIVKVRGTRIALGRLEASRILVEVRPHER